MLIYHNFGEVYETFLTRCQIFIEKKPNKLMVKYGEKEMGKSNPQTMCNLAAKFSNP